MVFKREPNLDRERNDRIEDQTEHLQPLFTAEPRNDSQTEHLQPLFTTEPRNDRQTEHLHSKLMFCSRLERVQSDGDSCNMSTNGQWENRSCRLSGRPKCRENQRQWAAEAKKCRECECAERTSESKGDRQYAAGADKMQRDGRHLRV